MAVDILTGCPPRPPYNTARPGRPSGVTEMGAGIGSISGTTFGPHFGPPFGSPFGHPFGSPFGPLGGLPRGTAFGALYIIGASSVHYPASPGL